MSNELMNIIKILCVAFVLLFVDLNLYPFDVKSPADEL